MLLILNAIEYYQDVVSNCYYTNTTATYNQNLKTLTIHLVSLNSTACNVFANGLMITTVVYELPNSFFNVIDQFDYYTTNTIILENINFNGIDPSTMLFNFSSISHYTIVYVQALNKQLSALDQCFYASQTVFKLFKDKFAITIVPTGACDIQLQYMKSLDVQIGTKQVTIDINQQTQFYINQSLQYVFDSVSTNGTTFLFGLKDTNITIQQNGNYVDQCQEPFIELEIIINMQIQQLTITSYLQPSAITIGYQNDPYADKLIYSYKTYLVGRMILLEDVLNQYQNIIEQSNRFQYRVSVQYTDGYGQRQVYSITNTFDKFDKYFVVHFFKCQENKQCLTAMVDINKDLNAKFQFDITCLKDLQFQTIFTTFSDRLTSCWQDGVIIKSKNQFCVNIVLSSNEKMCSFENQQKQFQVGVRVGTINLPQLFYFVQTTTITSNGRITDFCSNCQSYECEEQVKQFDIGYYLELNVSDGVHWSIIVMDRSLWQDYTNTTIIQISLGCTIVVICLFFTIIQVVRFKRQLKMQILRNKTKKNK